MVRFIVVVVLFFSVKEVSSQEVIDTLKTEEGTMLIYANRTWEYLEDQEFDGLLNPALHEFILRDSSLNFISPWDTEQCYSSNKSNDLSKLKDTLWLCVVDTSHKDFVIPFNGRITSSYGYRRGRYHNGIDIDLETGDTVVAAFSGKVRYAKYNDAGFGNLVVIRHYNGLETFYAHLSNILVVPNQEVVAGEPIGQGGNTGHSRGSHLHFETRFYDAPMNPEEIIDFKNKCIRSENLFVHKGLFQPGATASHGSLASVSSGQSSYYRIRSGDTLSQIARKHGTTVSRLCQINNIRPTTTLHIGRSLRVK
ncbi:MAG: M23 family metallopeptidase [Brumimicrobium sp.]|nr:M23 family metallopeptidase [Brumimicrobium sp.]